MIDSIRREWASSEPEKARILLRRNWLRLIIESHTYELERLCVTAPDPHDPHVLLIRACCRDLAGDSYGAEYLRGQGLRVAADDFVACFTDLLLAPDAETKAAVADRAHHALSQCAVDDDYSSALFLLGWAEVRLRRDFARAIALLRSAVAEAHLRERPETRRLAQSNLAFALTHAGLFTEAERVLSDLPSTPVPSDWDRYEGGLPEANRGCIAYWRGDFDKALALLEPVIREDNPGNNFEALARLYYVMSVIALERDDRYYLAARLLQGIGQTDRHGIPWDILRRVVSARLAHAQGDNERARAIAAPALTRTGAAVAHAVLAELYRAIDEPALSGQAFRLAAAAGMPRYARVSTFVTSAGLHSAAGRGEHAHAQLEHALEAAVTESVFAPFLVDDPVIADLLSAHAHWGSNHQEFLHAVLTNRGLHATVLDGVFTEREKDVLACLRTTMTAAEIANHLGIAYPTVKTHIRSIYRKLGVASRRDAVHATSDN
ncbi:LuxR family transcriptional regulator [Gordonia sp. PDNC005]|uniref:helix-turn-helix transcriptional regulator n=1 Tax=unclassified Gordonia (in: high G+C Gram-positive bacteria) TaxID=2657482 RepID=UPI001965811A|nr:LuxR family transcriptional regulator [Gordonia sp. PDNC005]QRY64215.1 LuxR family transcriptional regulator [Gordonia sp. PDNC005]